MFSRLAPLVVVWASLTVCTIPTAASGQWYSAGSSCHCLQPVAQTQYRTVPTTEYRKVRRKVRQPVIETKYVERPVTEYKTVVEQRTAEVPTVRYVNVTEYRTVQRDCGYWVTRCRPNRRISPCQYDNRPTLTGWLNRTGYALRTMLTPPYAVDRQYVPRRISQTIPVTRRVAVRETRKVTYNVVKKVPQTTTRKVAVNTLRYVEKEVESLQPVTVMRQVPIGTSIAYSYTPVITGGTQTALAPSPDPISSRSSQQTDRPERTADSGGNRSGQQQTDEAEEPKDKDLSGDHETDTQESDGEAAQPSSLSIPQPRSQRDSRQAERSRSNPNPKRQADSYRLRRMPSIVRVSRWRARQKSSDESGASRLSVAGTE